MRQLRTQVRGSGGREESGGNASAPGPAYRYHAFISYSHAADARLAPDLQAALHRFAKPWYRLRALRLFRDQTNLSASPSLWPLIQRALDESGYFILLASPDAAASIWVDREIRHWLAGKASDRILLVLTDGELVWDDAAGRFDPGASPALPAALAGAFQLEPLWVDLRWAQGSEQRSLRDSRFRDSVAELAATLHGRPKDEISGEDVRQHRRTRRTAWSAAMGLLLLAVGLGIAAWVALGQRNRAEERGAIALSRQLAAQAVALAGGERGDLALLLSLEALRVWPTVDARNGLLTALTRDPRRRFHLHGHMGEVVSLAFSPDGLELLSLGCEGIDVLGLCEHFGVRRWATGDGEPRGQTILPGASRFAALSNASSSGALVVRGPRSEEWDPLTGEALGTPAVPGAWSPRRDLVAELTGRDLRLRAGPTGRLVGPALRHGEDRIRSIAFHPTAPLVATGGEEGEVRLWNTGDLLDGRFEPDRILEAHGAAVTELVFSPDGRHLVSASWDRSVRVWELASPDRPRTLVERGAISSVLFTPDGRRMVVALSVGEDGGALQLWDAVSWQQIATLGGKAPIAISSDSRLLAAAGADGAVIVRDLDQLRPLGRPLHDAGDPLSLAFLDSGRVVVAGGRDGTLRVWDAGTARPRYAPVATGQEWIGALVAHPDGRRVVSGGSEGRILEWDLRDRPDAPLRVISAGGDPIGGLGFSPDGRLLASGAVDDTLRLRDAVSGEALASRVDAGQDIYSIIFDGDGQRVAAAVEDGSVLVWTPSDGSVRVVGTHLLQSDGMTGLAFGPDDRFLLSSSLEQTQFWGLAPAEPAGRPPIPGAYVALHPAGEVAAVVTSSGEIQLIDIAAWQPFDATLGAHDSLVYATAFSPDGRLLAAAARNELILWDVALDAWRAHACAIARRNLTLAERERYLGGDAAEPACPDAPVPPAIPLDAARALGLAVRAAKLGDDGEARRLFAVAGRLGAVSDDAELANGICWQGALHGSPADVLPVCERAVALDPENPHYRDSRGVARALTGDSAGAIDDFEAYIAWTAGDPERARGERRRRGWVEALRAGGNPFDPIELFRLQGEFLIQ